MHRRRTISAKNVALPWAILAASGERLIRKAQCWLPAAAEGQLWGSQSEV